MDEMEALKARVLQLEESLRSLLLEMEEDEEMGEEETAIANAEAYMDDHREWAERLRRKRRSA